MPSTRYHWLTRPQADSEEAATVLAEHNIPTLISPIMRIATHNVTIPPKPWHGIILTSRHSAHALEGVAQTVKQIPVFCVGTATAARARTLGFTNILQGEGDALSLIPLILAHIPTGNELLYLSGEETRVDLKTLLVSQQRHVETVIAYSAEAETTLSPQLQTALKTGTVTSTSFYSARSAALAIKLLKTHTLENAAPTIDTCCLSLAVAEAAALLPFKSVRVATSPTASALHDLIISTHGQTML